MSDLVTEKIHAYLCGKTYRVCYPLKITHSDIFWQDLLKKQSHYSQQGNDGQTLVMCLEKEPLCGEPSMLNISELPNDVKECLLWQVLESGGGGIAKILFEQKSLSGDIRPGRAAAENTTAFVAGSFGTYCQSDVGGTVRSSGGDLGGGSETFVVLNDQGGSQMNVETGGTVGTLRAETHGHLPIVVHGTQDPITCQTTAHCLGRNGGQENVLFEIKGEEAARVHTDNISPTLKARMGTGGNNVPCIALAGNTIGRKPGNGGNGNGNGFDESGVSYTLTSTDVHAVCWNGDTTPKTLEDKALTLRASQGGEGIGVATTNVVRKLTPVECERLQGFPDNYTKVPYRNKPSDDCPDSPRYKALGNSMAVPVMRWIGERVQWCLQSGIEK